MLLVENGACTVAETKTQPWKCKLNESAQKSGYQKVSNEATRKGDSPLRVEYRGCGRDLGVLSALARLLVVVKRAVGMVVQDVPLGGSRVCGGIQVIYRHHRRGRGSVLYWFRLLLHRSRLDSSRRGITLKIGGSHVALAGKSHAT